MSLWKRFQRIGMRAAKFQFTASVEELSVALNSNYTTKSIIIVFTRRGRRCSSKPISLHKSTTDDSTYTHIWSVPENLEFVTTLYRNDKDISYEDKEWTIHIEDVGDGPSTGLMGVTSTRKRVLAARNLNVSEFAAALPTQNNLKIVLRPASKKITSAQLFFTLHGLLIKSGEATDEDMMSVASMMSLTYSGAAFGNAYPVGCETSPLPTAKMGQDFRQDIAGITAQLQALERCPPTPVKEEEDEDESSPNKKGGFFITKKPINSTLMKQNGSNSSPSPSSTDIASSPKGSALSMTRKPLSQTEQDLLAWCRSVTANYPNVNIADLSTSFRSGLALCAIIHHFYPDSLDFNTLDKDNALENVRIAFDVASRLGVPRVLDPSEVASSKRSLDCLSMMTYLHQLRTILSLGATPEQPHPPASILPSSNVKREVDLVEDDSDISLVLKKMDISSDSPSSRSPSSLNKSGKIKPKPTGSASVRYGQLVDRARLLLKQSTCMDGAESNHNLLPPPANGVDISSDKEESNSVLNKDQTLTPSMKSPGLGIKVRKMKLSNMKLFSDSSSNPRPYTHKHHMDGGSPQHQATGDPSRLNHSSTNEIESEMNAISREQSILDAEAPGLERKLREVMQTGGNSVGDEEMLMRRWFQLVSKRNALLHRAYQLSIMDKECELQKTTELLKSELRELIEKPDHFKTTEDRRREEYLLREVVEVVNERDEIIQELDYQEQALVDEVALGLRTDQIAKETFGVPTNDIRNCAIQ